MYTDERNLIKRIILCGKKNNTNYITIDVSELIDELIEATVIARCKRGLLALEEVAANTKYVFLKRGIMVAVDAYTIRTIKEYMRSFRSSIKTENILRKYDFHLIVNSLSFGAVITAVAFSIFKKNGAVKISAAFILCNMFMQKLREARVEKQQTEQLFYYNLVEKAIMFLVKGKNPFFMKEQLMAFAGNVKKIRIWNI